MNKTSANSKLTKVVDRVQQFDMVEIPAGRFSMGSNSGSDFEAPVHDIELSAFYVSKTPVTNQQFQQFVEESSYVTTAEKLGYAWGYDGKEYRDIESLNWKSYATKERMQHPVILVSWFDAKAYAEWYGLRLPTEAQWEKAARAGLTANEYPWGTQEPNEQLVGFSKTPKAAAMPNTYEVKSFAANEYGLYDMVGNVWQWCGDFYDADYYCNSPKQNPQGVWDGKLRVRRGGAWNVVQAFRLRCSNRGALKPESVAPNMGFRCVL